MEIGIYGLGRFGAFWGSVLAQRHTVKGYSRSSSRPTPEGISRVELKELAQCEVIFICSAISSMEEVCRGLAPLLNPASLVFDTCSVKTYPVSIMEKTLPENISLMGSHPMFGPDSARYGIKNLPIVLSDVRCSDEQKEYWIGEFEAMGLQVLQMTPHEHDREAAFSQGLTHLVGRLLDELPLHPSPMATAGYKALLEIITQTCNDSRQLFHDIQKYNPYSRGMRKEFHDAFHKLEEEIVPLEDQLGDYHG